MKLANQVLSGLDFNKKIEEKIEPPQDTIIRWKNFLASDIQQQDFGADIVDFFGSLGWDAIKIKKELKNVSKEIKNGGDKQLKWRTRPV